MQNLRLSPTLQSSPTSSRTARRRSAVLAAAFLVLAPAVISTAQDGPQSLFGDVIDVRVVNLEVVVTQNGQRVGGLEPEDFLLTVDGQEVGIEYFTEVSGGTAVGHSQGAAELGTVPALAPGQPVGTSYLVFIDEFFTTTKQRDRVVEQMIEQLPMLTPEDRMAVVAYNGKKLDMLSTWSQSVDELTRVLQDAKQRKTYGMQRFSERRLFVPDALAETERRSRLSEFEEPNRVGAGFRVGSDLPTLEEEQLIEMLTEDVDRVVMAASATLRSFANPPGRKVMMMLAGGWPYTPAQWVVTDPNRALYTTGYGYGKNLYGPLIETANRLSYTLYPVDVPLRQDQTADATMEGSLSDIDPDSGAPVTNIEIDNTSLLQGLDNVRDQRTTLRRLALDTGGRAIFARDAMRALEYVVTDTRTYYWIGFTPKWKGDDEAHRVDVRVRRPGMQARTRQNFSDLSRSREVTMMVESALRLGDAPTATPFPAQIGEIKKAGPGRVEVPVQLLIPMQALTFLPHENRYVAEAELRVAVQDDDGILADIPVVPLSITLDKMPDQGEMRRWETTITLRKRKHDVVVSLYDNASGTILSTKLEVNPLL